MRELFWITDRTARSFTLSLIRSYFNRTGKSIFTYKELRIFYYKYYEDHTYDWHTIERVIRRFAEEGILSRLEVGKRVYFGFTDRGMKVAGLLEGFDERNRAIGRSVQ